VPVNDDEGATMRAYRMLAPGVAQLVEVPVPEPGPGQVRIDVVAAGLCHSDLHVVDGGAAASWRLPFTLGHEVCGTVAELGAGVTSCAVGDQVVVHAPWGCDRCARCVAGAPNYCDRRASLPAAGIGLGVDGGMAEALVVDAMRLVPVPGIDAAAAAVLSDAALTSFHALSGIRDLLGEDTTVVVIGVGGLGHVAVQLVHAVAAGTRVIAVDTRDEALELAHRLGAHDVARPGPDTRRAVTTSAGGRGADVVLDFVGAQATIDLGAAVLRPAGELVLVGSGGGRLVVSKPGALPAGARVRLPFWGSRAELVQVVELARSGLLEVETTTMALADAAAAFDQLRRAEVVGRLVLTR
jgi:alcohol dehydrogenase, propanol-preferring